MADQQGQFKLGDIQAPAATTKGQYSLLDVSPFPNNEPRPSNLPTLTNEDLKRWGKTALDYLPAAAATAGAIFAPELAPAYPFLSAVGGAAAGGAVGEATRQGTMAATGDPRAPKTFGQGAGETLKSAGEQALIEAGGRAVAKPFEWALGKIFSPERLYQSALKPSALLGPDEQAAIVRDGLYGIPGPVPAGGLIPGEKAYATNLGRIDQVNKAVLDRVQNAPPTRMVDPLQVADRLDALKAGSFGQQALNAEDLKVIDKAKRQYLEKHGAVFDGSGNMVHPPPPMTVGDAQVEKIATYRQNEAKYGQMSNAQDESEKAIAGGLKDSIAQIYPEINDLNQQESAMIRLNHELKRFVAREGNKNLVPVFKAGAISLATGAGALAHGEVGGVAGALLASSVLALDDPQVKAAMAMVLKTRAARMAGKLGQEAIPATARILAPQR